MKAADTPLGTQPAVGAGLGRVRLGQVRLCWMRQSSLVEVGILGWIGLR
jgi:hypothetical protein